MYNYRKIPIKRLKKSEVEFDFQMFGCCKFTLLLDHPCSFCIQKILGIFFFFCGNSSRYKL